MTPTRLSRRVTQRGQRSEQCILLVQKVTTMKKYIAQLKMMSSPLLFPLTVKDNVQKPWKPTVVCWSLFCQQFLSTQSLRQPPISAFVNMVQSLSDSKQRKQKSSLMMGLVSLLQSSKSWTWEWQTADLQQVRRSWQTFCCLRNRDRRAAFTCGSTLKLAAKIGRNTAVYGTWTTNLRRYLNPRGISAVVKYRKFFKSHLLPKGHDSALCQTLCGLN